MSTIGRYVSNLSGYAPAVPTPFDDNGHIDSAAFEQFCERQIREGATALVVCGTTGEAPTLSRAEHDTLIRIAVGVARGQIPVIAGTGSNSTAHAIELTKDAEAAGADAVLSVVPYYNKPTQGGLNAHFTRHRSINRIANCLIRRPISNSLRPCRRNGCPLSGKVAIHRSQGCHRRCYSAATTESARRSRFQASYGRRCHCIGLYCSRRQRLHFGHVQPRAGHVPESVPRLQAGADN